MIYDFLENSACYGGIDPVLWARAFDFIATVGPDHPDGRVELEGDRLYALIQSYDTKGEEKYRVETHRNYLDIQLLLEGAETIFYSPITELPGLIPYNPEKDIEFFGFQARSATPFRLYPGVFAVFFPGEGHLPGCGTPPQPVKKIVIKLRMN